MMKLMTVLACLAMTASGGAFAQEAPVQDTPSGTNIVKTSVLVDVHVDKAGHATEAHVVKPSGSKEADAKAVAAAMAWHFNPPMVRGQPTEANVRVPVVIESEGRPHS